MEPMTERMRVAITGGEGLVASIVRERLEDRFDFVPLSREDADVTDLAALERAFAGADAVLHLGANPNVDAEWDELREPNLDGAYHAFEAARRAGVHRVVFASSNHAMGGYILDDDRFVDRSAIHEVTSHDPVRPDSLYGASKAWGEAVGRFYAEHRGLAVICLRIGWVTDDDAPPDPEAAEVAGSEEVARRSPGMWLTHRDCASLVEAALTADVGFAIVNGVSDVEGRWFSLDEGRRLLGWEPSSPDR
jgi:NAD+ dependent glucose-6-phosphate dehydrogenase